VRPSDDMEMDEASSRLDEIEERLGEQPFVVHSEVERNGRILRRID